MTAVARRLATVTRTMPRSIRRRRLLVAIADHSLLIAAAIAFVAPVVFVSSRPDDESPGALGRHLAAAFRFENYLDVFRDAPLWRWALNSFIYASLATGLLISSIPVACAFACLRWRGRDLVFIIVLVALMLPPQVTVVPLYIMWAKLGLVGGLWPLIIPNWFGDAFAIFLLRQFFLTIPSEYLDAARVDGCGELRVTRVVMRLGKPAIAAVALFSSPLHVERLLPPAPVPEREPGELGDLDRPLAVPLAPPGAMEPDDGRDRARHAAGDRRVLPRPEGLRRGRDADGVKG